MTKIQPLTTVPDTRHPLQIKQSTRFAPLHAKFLSENFTGTKKILRVLWMLGALPKAFASKRRLVMFGAFLVLSSVLTMVHDAMIMSSFISRDGTTTVRVTDVVKLAINHVEPSSDVSAAVCFKTLFGEIDLGVVIQWAGTHEEYFRSLRQ